METYLLTYCLAVLFSTGLTPLLIQWARKKNLVDEPDPRKIHSTPVARIGGVAIFAGTMLALIPSLFISNDIGQTFRSIWVKVLCMLAASSLMFVVGLLDDLKGLRIRTRLIAQIMAGLIVCFAGIHIDKLVIRDYMVLDFGVLSIPFTLCWIIGVTNAVNLIDGLDGLAGGICAIACGSMACLSVIQGNIILATLMLAMFGGITGFLLFNFHPAKIFMGDSGSLFLGFTIATASVLTTAKSEALVGFGLPVLVLGIPIFDTLLSIMRRFLARRGIMSPDRGHFHHRLLDKGFKQHHVAIIAYVITLVASGVGFLMLATHRGTSLMVFVAGLTILLVIFKLAGSVGIHQILSDISTRSSIANARRIERQKYEASQLEFRAVENYEQWWACMCRAAKALDFARMSMELASEKGQVKTWCSESCPDEEGDETMEGLLQMKVPIKDGRNGDVHRMEIQVLTSGSLESAGRRAVLFTRLADENRLDKLVEKEIH
ncbi:MAG: undecaprenyl/decaprenyl-phosphate alpha-N-acetylglucosaminyl 1-phosphate transferase [Planctomycetes bacterium]|nr:undecaprenyl/decaprenyl-phosphate alpha-N-acetylglucosaminyl 1-phosphate transferase [Planctomycetota bacterium]